MSRSRSFGFLLSLGARLAALGLLAAVLLLEGVLFLLVLSGSGALCRFLSAEGSRITGGTVLIASARLEPFQGLKIQGLSAADSSGAGQFLEIGSLRAGFSLSSLFSGRFFPTTLIVEKPRVRIPAGGVKFPGLARTVRSGPVRIPPCSLTVLKGEVEMEGMPLAATGLFASLRADAGGDLVLDRASCSLTRVPAGGKKRGGRALAVGKDRKLSSPGEPGPGGDFGRLRIQGTYRLGKNPATIRFGVSGREILCSREIEPLLCLIGVLRDYEALSPVGRADFDFEGEPFVPGTPVHGRLRLHPRAMAAKYIGYPDSARGERRDGFPYPLEEVRGSILVRVPGRVTIESAIARAASGRVALGGEIVSRPGLREKNLEIEASQVRVDSTLVEVLDRAVGGKEGLFTMLGLHGEADVSVAVKTSLSGEDSSRSPPARVAVTALIRKAAIRPTFFPLPLEDVSGSVTFSDGRCTIAGFEGRFGKTILSGEGTVGPEGTLFSIEAGHVAVDRELLDAVAALSGKAAETLASLDPVGGDMTVRCRYERKAEEKTWDSIRLDITLGCCSARLPGPFPVRVENLAGTVEVLISPGGVKKIVLKKVTAVRRGGGITASGLFEGSPLTVEKLDLGGTDQALDGEILSALSANFKGLDAWLAGLDVRGSVDFHCTAEKGDVEILLHPRLDAVVSPRIPFPVSRVDGEVTYSSATGAFGFRDMIFRLRKGIVDIARGAVSPGRAGTTVTVKGSAQGLRLGEEIGPLLGPEGFGKWRLEGVGGMADVENADFSVVLDPRGGIESIKGRADVFFDRAGMTGPVRIENLNGEVSLTSRNPSTKDRFLDLSGAARNLFFRLEGKELTNVFFDFNAGDEAFRIRSLDGYLYGGRITGGRNAFRLAFAPPSSFKGSVSVAGTELNRLVGKGGYAFRDIHGRLNWKALFEGEMENLHKIKAQGRVEVADGRLWELPVFSTLWSQVGGVFGLSERPTFDNGSARYVWKEGTVVLSDAVLNSPLLSLRGSGVLAMDSANIRVQFSVGPRLPIISSVIAPVMRLINKGLFNLHVSGPYDDLDVSYDPILTSPFRSRKIAEPLRCPPRGKFRVFGRF